MKSELIVGLLIVLATAYQSWNTGRLEDKVEKLTTLRVYEKAIHDSNMTKELRFRSLAEKIRKDYEDGIDKIDNTPIGGTINFGGK
jgi:hypothetical protein